MALESWSCKGCTNICFQTYNGEIAQYCRALYDQPTVTRKWFGDKIECLEYTTDPNATDPQVRFWKPPIGKEIVLND